MATRYLSRREVNLLEVLSRHRRDASDGMTRDDLLRATGLGPRSFYRLMGSATSAEAGGLIGLGLVRALKFEEGPVVYRIASKGMKALERARKSAAGD
jgi:hypothetical protein